MGCELYTRGLRIPKIGLGIRALPQAGVGVLVAVSLRGIVTLHRPTGTLTTSGESNDAPPLPSDCRSHQEEHRRHRATQSASRSTTPSTTRQQRPVQHAEVYRRCDGLTKQHGSKPSLREPYAWRLKRKKRTQPATAGFSLPVTCLRVNAKVLKINEKTLD